MKICNKNVTHFIKFIIAVKTKTTNHEKPSPPTRKNKNKQTKNTFLMSL